MCSQVHESLLKCWATPRAHSQGCTFPGVHPPPCLGCRGLLPGAAALGTCLPPVLQPRAGPQACLPKVSSPADSLWLTGPRTPCLAGLALSVLSISGWPCGWCGGPRRRGIRAGNCCVKMTAQRFIHPKPGLGIPRGCRQLGINTAPEKGLLGRKGGLKDP